MTAPLRSAANHGLLPGRRRRGGTGRRLLPAVLTLVLAVGACSRATGGLAAECEASPRLALVAQSVPGAAYVPCLEDLPEGWTAGGLDVHRGGTRFTLLSDRADGRAVEVRLQPGCDVAAATSRPPRSVGVRTSTVLESVSPRYAGVLYDAFPGGCVSYRFDFARGPHIALMDELLDSVGLFSRRDLGHDLRRDFGLELDP